MASTYFTGGDIEDLWVSGSSSSTGMYESGSSSSSSGHMSIARIPVQPGWLCVQNCTFNTCWVVTFRPCRPSIPQATHTSTCIAVSDSMPSSLTPPLCACVIFYPHFVDRR
jgi:hypothetical protein